MKKYIRVVVAVELVTVGAKIEPTSWQCALPEYV